MTDSYLSDAIGEPPDIVARHREHLAGLEERLRAYDTVLTAAPDFNAPGFDDEWRRAAVRVVEYLASSGLVDLLRDVLAGEPADPDTVRLTHATAIAAIIRGLRPYHSLCGKPDCRDDIEIRALNLAAAAAGHYGRTGPPC